MVTISWDPILSPEILIISITHKKTYIKEYEMFLNRNRFGLNSIKWYPLFLNKTY